MLNVPAGSALYVFLAGAVTTNELPCKVSFQKEGGLSSALGGTREKPDSQKSVTSGATAVCILTDAGANNVNKVSSLSVYNKDTVAQTATVAESADGGVTFTELKKAVLAAGQTLTYEHGKGWADSQPATTGALTFSGAVEAQGAIIGDTTLAITGASTLSGNVSAGGTLGVTGISTFTGGMRQSVENGITAHAGGGQGSAYALTKTISRVTTVGTAGDSVKLPAATAGDLRIVSNNAAVNSMNIFPASGEAINALGADAAYALVVTKTVLLYCTVAGTWDTLLTA